MKNNNFPQKKTDLSIQNDKEKQDIDKSREHEIKMKQMELHKSTHENNTNLKNKALDTFNNLSNNKLESEKLEYDARQKGIDNKEMFKVLNKTIDKKFSQQDRAMDNAEKTLDKALDKWDKDVIMKSLDKLADVANTNPLGNTITGNTVKKEISLSDFDDDDFMIEI
jgi:flagellar biosynthesis GTPase FlhF